MSVIGYIRRLPPVAEAGMLKISVPGCPESWRENKNHENLKSFLHV